MVHLSKLKSPFRTPNNSQELALQIAAVILVILASAAIALAWAPPPLPHEQPVDTHVVVHHVVPSTAFNDVNLIARSAIVVDLRDMHTLYSMNADAQLPLASITKVPMALAVSEAFKPDDVITIPEDTSPPGSAEHLGKGEQWHVGDVIDFTLVASSNEGAEILADAADPILRAKYPQAEGNATLWRMNDLARELGLTNTYFLDVTGLDVSETQAGAYGSARDVAALFAHAASTSLATFSQTTRNTIKISAVTGQHTVAYNTNEALPAISGLVMGKTGYTDLAGGNLAIVFDVGPAHPIVAVVLGSTQEGRFADMEKLVSATQNQVAGK